MGLILVYLGYGGAFLVTAAILLMQAVVPVKGKLVPRRVLWLLFGFAITHALVEWVRMAELMATSIGAYLAPLSSLLSFFLGLSFVFLFMAAVELRVSMGSRPQRA